MQREGPSPVVHFRNYLLSLNKLVAKICKDYILLVTL